MRKAPARMDRDIEGGGGEGEGGEGEKGERDYILPFLQELKGTYSI